MHLTGRLLRRLREAQATTSATATAANNATYNQKGSVTSGGGGGEGGISEAHGGVGAAAEASAMIAECVREACREVDAKVGLCLLLGEGVKCYLACIRHGAVPLVSSALHDTFLIKHSTGGGSTVARGYHPALHTEASAMTLNAHESRVARGTQGWDNDFNCAAFSYLTSLPVMCNVPLVCGLRGRHPCNT